MDLKISADAEWKSVSYEHAKEILKKTRIRTGSLSLDELETLAHVAPRDLKKRRRDTLIESDSDDDMNSTIIAPQIWAVTLQLIKRKPTLFFTFFALPGQEESYVFFVFYLITACAKNIGT